MDDTIRFINRQTGENIVYTEHDWDYGPGGFGFTPESYAKEFDYELLASEPDETGTWNGDPSTLKVHISGRCTYCHGQALIPMGEYNNGEGETHTVYGKCPICQGDGESTQLVSLPDFLELLKQVTCQHEHTTQHGGMHFSGGDVWDDIQEVCIDCGANLDDPAELIRIPNE